MALKYPVFYMYLHNELKRAANQANLIRRKDALKHLGRGHNIEKNISSLILKEMEKYSMIVKVKNGRYDAYKVNCISAINIIEHPSKIYEELGIF